MLNADDVARMYAEYEKCQKYQANGGHGRVICEGALKADRAYMDACNALSRAGLIVLPKIKYRNSIKNYRSSKVH